MARVGDELAHLLLRPPGRSLGPGPRLKGSLNLAQHDVQRPAEPADLSSRILLRHPSAQVTASDRPRRLLDVRERPQTGPDYRDSNDPEQGDHNEANQQVDSGQLAESGVHAGDVDCQHDCTTDSLTTADVDLGGLD